MCKALALFLVPKRIKKQKHVHEHTHTHIHIHSLFLILSLSLILSFSLILSLLRPFQCTIKDTRNQVKEPLNQRYQGTLSNDKSELLMLLFWLASLHISSVSLTS